jgi:hypothetical protein
MNDLIGWSAAGELKEEVRVELLHLGETGDASLASTTRNSSTLCWRAPCPMPPPILARFTGGSVKR